MIAQSRSRAVPSPSFSEARLRFRRWRFFRIVFVFTYVGIILDVITTAVGAHIAGSTAAYEQNPLGGALISYLGWPGILATMTALMLVTYSCLRIAHTRVSQLWMRFFNWFLVIVGAVRWLAVLTALMYISHPTT